MATNQLAGIRRFTDLVRYLEDELGWPLQEYGFDDLTFEFSPAEIGLKDEDAARVKVIHQLRPLASGQPWGIFFVEFENKKLPVVVLRRILSHLALKKRASANKANAPSWHAEDLLFITAFGEEGGAAREIAFAHFHENPGDLPTLHVLGWDGSDTPLKLANVDRVLHERLRWPDDESDSAAWRETWRKPFRHKIGHVIRTADLLAEELARLARGIRDKAKRMLAAESDKGPLTQLYKAFQTALIHDLTPEGFADTYAQTITYGLLTAAISRTEMSEGRHGTALIAQNVVDMVPVTNPFLKEMLQTFLKVGGRKGGIDFDELGIQDVVELLRGEETDLPAILRDFGNKTRGEDPVIHFYEHFLSAYNKQLKIQRGVFYTPQPVVGYIVRSVHELLQTEFGLEDGLASTITWAEMAQRFPSPSGRGAGGEGRGEGEAEASFPPVGEGQGERGQFKIPEGTDPASHFVTILDPATGTATFLVEVISVIHRTLSDKWKKQGMTEAQRLEAWNDYVPKHLLPRLYGYELMMAPYAIAHMKIGLKLHETGYRFGSEERVRVYLTNALEPAHEVQPQLEALAPALAHEAQAVAGVKREIRFTVVVGNPPYSGHSVNNQVHEIVDRVHDYKRGYPDLQKPGQGKWLQNDYVKFIRLAEMRIGESGLGILGFITDHSYLDNPTFKGMRRHLLASFPRIRIADLHGNSKKREKTLDGGKDENVFDITQGAAIGLFSSITGCKANVRYADVWGERAAKYQQLMEANLDGLYWSVLTPTEPFQLFRPQDTSARDEYDAGWPLPRIFAPNGDPAPGIVTTHDEFAISWNREEAIAKVEQLLRTEDEAEARQHWQLCTTNQWSYARAKRELQDGAWEKELGRVLYRPFDERYSVFDHNIAVHRRDRASGPLRVGKNIALITVRQVPEGIFRHALISRNPVDNRCTFSSKGVALVFPLWLYSTSERSDLFDDDLITSLQSRRPNLASDFIAALVSALRLSVADWQPEIQTAKLNAEAVFSYIYAVLHSPAYRTRYRDLLCIDFARIPLPDNLPVFQSLAILGSELVALHLLESPKVNTFITRFEGQGDNSVPRKPTYKDGAVWINPSQRFEGVPEAVWNFHIGGYQVCEKWLKDRKGRTLNGDDIAHYQRVVVALNETIRLMAEIDRVIETHGGWPGAFASNAKAGTQS